VKVIKGDHRCDHRKGNCTEDKCNKVIGGRAIALRINVIR